MARNKPKLDVNWVYEVALELIEQERNDIWGEKTEAAIKILLKGILEENKREGEPIVFGSRAMELLNLQLKRILSAIESGGLSKEEKEEQKVAYKVISEIVKAAVKGIFEEIEKAEAKMKFTFDGLLKRVGEKIAANPELYTDLLPSETTPTATPVFSGLRVSDREWNYGPGRSVQD